MIKKLIATFVAMTFNDQFHKCWADMKNRPIVIAEYDEPIEYTIQRTGDLETQLMIRFKSKPPKFFTIKVTENN